MSCFSRSSSIFSSLEEESKNPHVTHFLPPEKDLIFRPVYD
jgi:hypothetical protein